MLQTQGNDLPHLIALPFKHRTMSIGEVPRARNKANSLVRVGVSAPLSKRCCSRMRKLIHSPSQRQRRQIDRTAIEAIDKLRAPSHRAVELVAELLQAHGGMTSFQAFDASRFSSTT